jgi:hypothetical protein
MARIALTTAEKQARGTHERCKDRTRSLETILAEVAEVERVPRRYAIQPAGSWQSDPA